MKPIAFCLIFALATLHSGCGVEQRANIECVDLCGEFLTKYQNTPLPDSLALCLEGAVRELKQASSLHIGPYVTSLFYHANQLSLTGHLRQAAEVLHIVDSILPNIFLFREQRAHTSNALSIVYGNLYEIEYAVLYNEKAITGYRRTRSRILYAARHICCCPRQFQ